MSPENPDRHQMMQNVLGYLNFSSGATDHQFLDGINYLYARAHQCSAGGTSGTSPLHLVHQSLNRALEDLQRKNSAFADSVQAKSVIETVFSHIMPAYRERHRDLLFHHTDDTLWRPLFVGRIFEAALRQGAPWDDVGRITSGALTQLNDFVGHRPVAALESRKLEPYSHEWVRPIPIFIRGVGVEYGRYRKLVQHALSFLENADEEVLRPAHFELERMEELAIDPRACDFDHPAGKRPNYVFGQWDPHHIDQSGYYSRFVLRDVTLDALMRRVEQPGEFPGEQLLVEAAAALAGTILMASGISGWGPGAHDSATTLGNLLPRVAAYRDLFYECAMQRFPSGHYKRLEEEAAARRQPFGAARQELNAQLARCRARQLQCVYLAKVFACMGYPEAAAHHSAIVPVASARMLCYIDCCLMDSQRILALGNLASATDRVAEAVDTLHRAIICGAVIDPWNILGFDANYALFPAPENSIRDVRADDLIELMEQIFSLYGCLWSESAARNDRLLGERIAADFKKLADWWHDFAVHEVSSVDGFNAQDSFVAAERASQSLGLWHQRGAEGGDVRFWAPHAQKFKSPESFAMVVRAMLDRDDYAASMSLLVYWLSEADRVGLEQGNASFQQLAFRWLRQVKGSDSSDEEKWNLVQKFFDYVEANAQEYWQVPRFDLATTDLRYVEEDLPEFEEEEQLDEDEDLFGAAYESVVYRDSTDDGIDSPIHEGDSSTEVELDEQSRRLADRLTLLECLADLWRIASMGDNELDSATEKRRAETLRRWLDQILINRRELLGLISNIHRFKIPTPAPIQESLLQYDRHRLLKETILEKAIATCIATCNATRFVLAALIAHEPSHAKTLKSDKSSLLEDIEFGAAEIVHAILRGDRQYVADRWDAFLESLQGKSLLYVPLSRRGEPHKIVRARLHQRIVEDFLKWLPRLGMLKQACELIKTARRIERNQPSARAAVTEFDTLFETGFRALVETIVKSAANWKTSDPNKASIVDCVEPLTQSMLLNWLAHSRTLRLSVLERVADERKWHSLVEFIDRYGSDLFTQSFLGLGNVRAILHQGVGEWLDRAEEDGDDQELHIIEDLDRHVSHEEATDHLTLILEAIVENYGEYRDYNSTTTQSDRGELLYTLLDFLRLRVEYDRIAWNLKPVALAHEMLVRNRRHADAELWRRALVERTQERAEGFLARLAELQRTHAMQMPTVADRLSERFLRPLIIDRMTALVEPAMAEATLPGPNTAFDLLEQEANALADEPVGVGLDVPDWLVALDVEANRVRDAASESEARHPPENLLPQVSLTLEEIQSQLDEWNETQENEMEE